MIVGVSLLLAAAPSADGTPVVLRGHAAVIDCQVEKAFKPYPVPSTAVFVGRERWVFHVRNWGSESLGEVLWEVTDSRGNTYSNSQSIITSVNGDSITISMMYSDLGQANLVLTSSRNGTATLSSTEKMRHGDGEYQSTGTCNTLLKQAPKGLGR
ncbi:hypothetical protein [Porphyrobacter sp. ULC335]|uniref:hypothetical protein n=1 Tax=Porphyrobacter sp. ULC335 TaxID=2854260 RepID=UPI00221ED43D|nr:hypothetical protein [Porphyrobacter sp. ULC335]UYV14881.1 hypothetical protein KVF90_12140 [Porphyrobacter sp. ULC335]